MISSLKGSGVFLWSISDDFSESATFGNHWSGSHTFPLLICHSVLVGGLLAVYSCVTLGTTVNTKGFGMGGGQAGFTCWYSATYYSTWTRCYNSKSLEKIHMYMCIIWTWMPLWHDYCGHKMRVHRNGGWGTESTKWFFSSFLGLCFLVYEMWELYKMFLSPLTF